MFYILDFFEFPAGDRKGNNSGFLPIYRRLALISASLGVWLFLNADIVDWLIR
jgi:hypothetical protein